MRRSLQILIVVLLITGLSFFISACGGGGGGGSSADSTPSTDTTRTTTSTITTSLTTAPPTTFPLTTTTAPPTTLPLTTGTLTIYKAYTGSCSPTVVSIDGTEVGRLTSSQYGEHASCGENSAGVISMTLEQGDYRVTIEDSCGIKWNLVKAVEAGQCTKSYITYSEYGNSVLYGSCENGECTPGSTTTTTTTTTTTIAAPTTTINYPESGLTVIELSERKFTLPANTISFNLGIFGDSEEDGTSIYIPKLYNPNGQDVLEQYSNLSKIAHYNRYSANVLRPLTPSMDTPSGDWTFIVGGKTVSSYKLAVRTGTSTPKKASFTVQPYITGSRSNYYVYEALRVLGYIYRDHDITMNINTLRRFVDEKYSTVEYDQDPSSDFSFLNRAGEDNEITIIFVEDVIGKDSAGFSPQPGAIGIGGYNSNVVFVLLEAHSINGSLAETYIDMAETTAHEIGHFLGLSHTTEKNGTSFDLLDDTPECPITLASDPSSGKISVDDCTPDFDGRNLMFPINTTYYQRELTSDQLHVLYHSPIAE